MNGLPNLTKDQWLVLSVICEREATGLMRAEDPLVSPELIVIARDLNSIAAAIMEFIS